MAKTCTKCGKEEGVVTFRVRDGNICKSCVADRDRGKDWAFQEKKKMDRTKLLQDFYTTYRPNGGEL